MYYIIISILILFSIILLVHKLICTNNKKEQFKQIKKVSFNLYLNKYY